MSHQHEHHHRHHGHHGKHRGHHRPDWDPMAWLFTGGLVLMGAMAIIFVTYFGVSRARAFSAGQVKDGQKGRMAGFLGGQGSASHAASDRAATANQTEDCRTRLARVREQLRIGKPVSSLAELGEQSTACPEKGNNYYYVPETKAVACTTNGHELY